MQFSQTRINAVFFAFYIEPKERKGPAKTIHSYNNRESRASIQRAPLSFRPSPEHRSNNTGRKGDFNLSSTHQSLDCRLIVRRPWVNLPAVVDTLSLTARTIRFMANQRIQRWIHHHHRLVQSLDKNPTLSRKSPTRPLPRTSHTMGIPPLTTTKILRPFRVTRNSLTGASTTLR